MKARRFSRICSRPCQSAMPRLQVASSARQLTPPPNVLSSISFQNASSHFGGSVFDMVRVVASFSSCIRFGIASFAPPNVRRLAPSTPNMGSTGHGRNYARSNKRVEGRETACNEKSSALLGINAEKCLVTNKSRVGHPEVIQARRGNLANDRLREFNSLFPIPCSLFPVPYSLSSFLWKVFALRYSCRAERLRSRLRLGPAWALPMATVHCQARRSRSFASKGSADSADSCRS